MGAASQELPQLFLRNIFLIIVLVDHVIVPMFLLSSSTFFHEKARDASGKNAIPWEFFVNGGAHEAMAVAILGTQQYIAAMRCAAPQRSVDQGLFLLHSCAEGVGRFKRGENFAL